MYYFCNELCGALSQTLFEATINRTVGIKFFFQIYMSLALTQCNHYVRNDA